MPEQNGSVETLDPRDLAIRLVSIIALVGGFVALLLVSGTV